MCLSKLIYVPFGSFTHKSEKKNSQSIESSIMLFEEHERWKNIMGLEGYSLGQPSNLAMSKGSLVGILDQVALCQIGSLISFFKSRRFILTM